MDFARYPFAVVHRVISLALLALALAAVVAPASAAGPAPEPSQAKYETRFLTDMIDHHHMAVMMSEQCVNKAVHPELAALCQQIIQAQSQEIQTMSAWLQSWYAVAYTPQMHGGMMHMLERLEGADFEVAFMRMMIRHHYRAVVAAVRCMDRAYHAELADLCANIVTTQTAEIRTMQAWLCQWYGLCHVGPRINEEE